MSDRDQDDDRLREAFQGLRAVTDESLAPEDLDRIWRAARGELEADARRVVVDRMAVEPAVAEAWRIAYALAPGPAGAAQTTSRPMAARWRGRWLATAAVALLAVSAIVVSRRGSDESDTLRNATPTLVDSLVGDGAALPRDAFRLRWSRGPEGSRYRVSVTTADLRHLATVDHLEEPEVTLDPTVLSSVQGGQQVLWQVEVTLPDGSRATSTTFVTSVR